MSNTPNNNQVGGQRFVRQNFANINGQNNQNSNNIESKNVKTNDANPIVQLEQAQANFSTSLAGMKNSPVLITETCKLPSKGLLYGNALGDTIELRAMTTIEERMRLSGENFWSTMSAIMNRCLVNSNFDTKNLVDFDFFAAMVKLRIITYGNIYKTRHQCLSCEKFQDVDVDLDNVIITELEDDFVEPIEIGPMPRSGDILGIRFLRVFDHIDILNQSLEYQNKKKKDVMGNPQYTMEMEKMLVSVNGNTLDTIAKRKYIETMVGMDSSYFHRRVEKLFYGVHRIGTEKCSEPDCSGLVVYNILPNENFFRTAFDD